MNQHKIRVLSYLLALVLCATLMSACIHPEEGDYPTTPVETTGTGQQFTTPEESTPEQTTTDSTTPEQTTPDVTSPDGTTTENTTPAETTTENTTPVETTTPEVTTPPETTPVETTTEQPDTPPEPEDKIKIYIDQGHNPFSPTHPPSWNTGASNEKLGLYEQDLTYEIGMLLYDLLMQDDRFEVRLSRPTADTILGTDNDSALDFRVNDAAAWGADYFISLHINSYSSSSASGLELCYTTRDTIGKELGTELIDALAEATGLRIRDPKLKEDLRVLKNAKMPATLVEMGFISNENDAILLRDHPELFAQGLYDGIQAYFNALETETPTE